MQTPGYDDRRKKLTELIAQKALWAKTLGLRASDIQITLPIGALDSSGDMQQPVSSTGIQVSNRFNSDMLEKTEFVGASPTSVPLLVPAGETWEIYDLLGDLEADVNAANRDVYVSITKALRGGTTPVHASIWTSEVIRVTLNQLGALWLSSGQGAGSYLVDTNGTITISTILDNPMPIILRAGEGVHITTTLGQLTDILTIRVQYRRVA